MKTIKIIDLLNKIANGEEVPKKLIFACKEYKSDDPVVNTHKDQNGNSLFKEYYLTKYLLNSEVEIIEEEKEIEKITSFDGDKAIITIVNTLNNVIDTVNELKKNK